jgi:sialidase-1
MSGRNLTRALPGKLCAVALAACAPLPASRPLSPLDLAVAGAGSSWYRIPALTVTTRGTVLAAFDARPTLGDLPSLIRVVLRRSTDGGRSFGPQIVVRSGPAPEGYGDPSFLVDRVTHRVFLFYAAARRQGFTGSHAGVGRDDPDILQADYSYSDDDGRTWRHRRITPSIKDSAWGGLFAASGEGIQLRHGPHAGRLVQQYAVRRAGANWAASAWSDDHGETWQMGALAGPGADENKSVELADGRLMLNVRATPYRKVAWSDDGGERWSALQDDSALVDPGNNGSVIRYAPDAPASDPRAHWLLLSNTADARDRVRLTVSLSCDDGRTWPVRRVIEPGSAGYSTLTRLGDGRFGVLYEREGYRRITFAVIGEDAFAGGCYGA